MKIAYIYTALLSVGGVDRILTSKANYLADKLGYDVYIITDSQRDRPAVFPLSPKVRHIDLETDFDKQYHHCLPIRALYYFVLMRQYKKRLTKLLDEINPDIVDTTVGREMDFIGNLKRSGRIVMGEIHTVKKYMRNFHLLIAQGGIRAAVAKYWTKKQERNVSKLDRLIVLTEADAYAWKSVVRTEVIPNFSPISSSYMSPKVEKKSAIAVGRYEEEKGFDMLIDAWAIVYKQHPDWTIDIFGQGRLKDDLERQISANGLKGIVTLNQPTQNIKSEYENSDFFVLSSRFEGFGLVLVEAMSCGIPCVSFDCPNGPKDIIRNGEDGLLVDNGNVKALAEGIVYMIEHPEERKAMGLAAKENMKRYSIDAIMEKWDKLFKSLVDSKK